MNEEKERQEEESQQLPESRTEDALEADIVQEESAGEPVPQPDTTYQATEAEEQEPEPKKRRNIFRRILIWLVVIALAFAAGFYVDSYLRYQPQRELTAERTAELEEARTEINRLEDEIDRLSVFEEINQQLEEENVRLETHLTVLSTRVAVANATLAVAQDNISEARLALDKVGTNLEKLESMLNAEQVEVVQNMQQRHELIVEEVEVDTFTALSDLEVLASKLLSLENTLFVAP